MRKVLVAVCMLIAWSYLSSAVATWVPTGKEDPKVKEWFESQYIMAAAHARLRKEYGLQWTMCCSHADSVRVKFVVEGGQYYGIPVAGGEKFLLPADTIHPEDTTMPEQLAMEGVVMVVPKGLFGAPKDIVTYVWLPQTGG